MKVIFPDSKLLQPMPTPYVHPNISGNVNNTPAVLPEGAPNQNTTSEQNAVVNTQPNNASEKNDLAFYAIWCLIVMFIATFIIVIYKKNKNKIKD